MVELEIRFARVARNRTVSVRLDPQDSILARDYAVGFNSATNSFEVTLRRDGCFEGAYRCIERFIEAQVERLDGINPTPADHLDFRNEMQYWILEQIYEQFRSDVESAIGQKKAWLDRERPGEGVTGEIKIETRIRSLEGLLAHLQQTDDEVRRAVLSPQTVRLLKSIGLDVFDTG